MTGLFLENITEVLGRTSNVLNGPGKIRGLNDWNYWNLWNDWNKYFLHQGSHTRGLKKGIRKNSHRNVCALLACLLMGDPGWRAASNKIAPKGDGLCAGTIRCLFRPLVWNLKQHTQSNAAMLCRILRACCSWNTRIQGRCSVVRWEDNQCRQIVHYDFLRLLV
jgi:hypothetical protein